MATRVQIRCITQGQGSGAHQRITHVGGINPDGRRWRATVAQAIAWIRDGTYAFFVGEAPRAVDVIIARTSSGFEYLKTVADGELPNNLLALPECPP